MSSTAEPVLAAGAVLWRVVDDKLRVLVVHRTQHRDVSLPKGKVDPGETLPETAVREIAEETGLIVALGAPLGLVEYTMPNGREKHVWYWQAEVSAHAVESSHFESNDEIFDVEWLSLKKARRALSYPHDIELVDRFADRWKAGRARTFAIITVRHGKAVPPEVWDGPDSTRPLMQRGVDQATSVAPGIAAWRPSKIITSTATRCIATIEPVARLTGVRTVETHEISQDAYERGNAAVAGVVRDRIAKARTTVLCSHGPVIPDIIAEVARVTHSRIDSQLRRSAALSTGEYTVLHLSVDNPTSGIVAVETHSPSVE